MKSMAFLEQLVKLVEGGPGGRPFVTPLSGFSAGSGLSKKESEYAKQKRKKGESSWVF
jgi:hypothetical protein